MKRHPTDLTNNQWDTIVKIIPDKRKRKNKFREVFNALFYLLKSGCQWRMLPKCFPDWRLVYYYIRKCIFNGTINLIMNVIRGKI
ncbi:MAG: transposase [Bacteroidales bacterium]|nr:transposase [Bacteroidales bacterium]